MAIEVYCDYCGERIEDRFAKIEVGGRNSPLGVKRELFQYHPEPPDGGYVACYEQAARMLADMARWAHREEGSPLQWRLDQRAGAALAKDPKPWATTPIRGSLPLDEAELHPRAALALRRGGVRTLEEAAERSEVELLAIEGVATTTVHRLAEAIAAHGLEFQAGPTPDELGRRIRELREAAGMTREEVAHAIRTDGDEELYGSDVGSWEAGRRVPTPRRLERVAQLFRVPIESVAVAEALDELDGGHPTTEEAS